MIRAYAVVVSLGLALGAYAQREVPGFVSRMEVTPLRADGTYRLGEEAGWKIRSWLPDLRYTLRENGGKVLEEGPVPLRYGKAELRYRAKRPSMLFLEVFPARETRKAHFGAAVQPDRIRTAVPMPKDFDAFWDRKLRELRAIPENPVVESKPSDRPGVRYEHVRMDHVNGTKVYGQLARPDKPGKFPAVLQLQWAGGPYPLQPVWVTSRASDGWLALNVQAHDVPVGEPASFYNALPPERKAYHLIRQDDLERSYFVEMYLRGVRAVDYLQKHPNWDGKTLLIVGTSMGGQQGLAVAGLHPGVTHLIVHVPAGADLNGFHHGRAQGYPFLTVTNQKAMEVARYVDVAHLARRIRATSLVSLGYVDTVCPPAGVWAAFHAIPSRKLVVPLVDSPHNHVATAEQQRPYTERSNAWLQALIAGRPVPVR